MTGILHRRHGTVLAVDDEELNLALVEEILGSEGFEVLTAPCGEDALEIVADRPPDCIVLDVMMPGIDGFELCSILKGKRATFFIPILMLTALSDTRSRVRALELGADDFLTKPVEVQELIARVSSLVRIKRMRDELESAESIIVSMVGALEGKHPSTVGHSQRVAALAVELAGRAGLSPLERELIGRGALLHDLGKIGLPDTVLDPCRLLDETERAVYRRHSEMGERILTPFVTFARLRSIVRHHHERIDGQGYPDGLSGEEIDLPTEIVAIANAWDQSLICGADADRAAQDLRDQCEAGAFRAELVDLLLEKPWSLPEISSVDSWQKALPPVPLPGPGRVLLGGASFEGDSRIRRILEEEGYEVEVEATTEALTRRLNDRRPGLVLLDLSLSDGDGLLVCSEIKRRLEREVLPVVIVAVREELSLKPRSLIAGADDFLLRPVNRQELLARVKSLFRLRLYFRDLEETHSVILSLAAALEARDPYTRGHSERVGALAAQLAAMLGMDEQECTLLRTAGQLHDIGKIGMPEFILNKSGPLSENEASSIREHPVLSEQICRPLQFLQPVLPLIRHHHERFNGDGYPDGLRGEKIPRGARILGLADAFDALTSSRSYRENFSPERALEILTAEAESGLWDREVLAALVSLTRRNVG